MGQNKGEQSEASRWTGEEQASEKRCKRSSRGWLFVTSFLGSALALRSPVFNHHGLIDTYDG